MNKNLSQLKVTEGGYHRFSAKLDAETLTMRFEVCVAHKYIQR